jgi:hypothetical protein
MKWLMLYCMVTTMMLTAEPDISEKNNEQTPLIIHNTNAINVENKRDLRDCSSCVGSEFKACMRSLTKEDFVTNICKLHPRACTAYVQQLKGEEIVEIRKLFTTQEWYALPKVFIQAMYECFEVARKKAEDAWWDRMFARLYRIGAFNND